MKKKNTKIEIWLDKKSKLCTYLIHEFKHQEKKSIGTKYISTLQEILSKLQLHRKSILWTDTTLNRVAEPTTPMHLKLISTFKTVSEIPHWQQTKQSFIKFTLKPNLTHGFPPKKKKDLYTLSKPEQYRLYRKPALKTIATLNTTKKPMTMTS